MRAPFLFLTAALLLPGCAPETSISAAGQTGPAGKVALEPPPAGTLQVSFLDVGQGDSELIQTPGKQSILIDGGPSDAGETVLKDLKQAGVEKLDWIIASHPHEDHIGGLPAVLRGIKVNKALDPGYNHGTSTQKTYLSLMKEKGVQAKLARSGDHIDLGDGVRMEILAPEEPLLKGTDSDPNNNSIVLRLVYRDTSFLFTGDMEGEERARLLKSHPSEEVKAQVLKLAHHGSHNGTDSDFLKSVQPTYAVISCAKRNDYGHPHKAALEALGAAGCKVLRTDQSGTIVIRSDGKSLRTLNMEAPGATSPDPAVAEGKVIGNRSSKIYHAPDCPSLPRESRRVEFESAAAAEKAGYRPHKSCIKE